jgi:hypothetical protein
MGLQFIENLQIIITSNYGIISNSHILQFTTTCTKSPESAISYNLSFIYASYFNEINVLEPYVCYASFNVLELAGNYATQKLRDTRQGDVIVFV